MTRDVVVVLYTRRDCGLCDETADELRRLALCLRFRLAEQDVDADPALRERYNDLVPVVVVNGHVVAAAPVDPGTLERALEQALG